MCRDFTNRQSVQAPRTTERNHNGFPTGGRRSDGVDKDAIPQHLDCLRAGRLSGQTGTEIKGECICLAGFGLHILEEAVPGGEVIEFEIVSVDKPDLYTNMLMFKHANGTIKPTKVDKFK